MDDFAEFAARRRANRAALGADAPLKTRAMEFIRDAGRRGYSYNFDWMGLPIIQFPQDILGLQEIIWRVKPEVIVETGVARGGSVVFSASMLALLGGDGVVIGVEKDLRPHNRAAILAHPMADRIRLIDGSSTAPDVVARVTADVGGRRTLVILDSNHTHDHVLAELRAYRNLVPVGSYIVVFDTVIADMPDDYFPDRPWDRANNPKTAVHAFLSEAPDFEIDTDLEAQLTITCAPDGWLKRIR